LRIGVPKESKDREYRVGMVPDGVRQLASVGHEICVERGAGEGSGFDDAAYREAGAMLVDTAEAWSGVELVVKVKEPNVSEIGLLREGQTLFCYLHLAA
jgi:alanine dehydrogenase